MRSAPSRYLPMVIVAGPIAWLVWALINRVPPSDALALVTTARPFADCVAALDFPCGTTQFPLFQQTPAVITVWLGFSIDGSLRTFEVASILAIAFTIVASVWVAQRRQGPAVAALVGLILIPSPLLYYAGTSWGEPIAVALNLAVVLSFVLRLHWGWVLLAALVAGTTKEVAFPIIMLVGAACAIAVYGSERERLYRSLGALTAGAVAGQVLDGLLNLARYGHLSNDVYNSIPAVPGIPLRSELALGLWVAPGGGVGAYWPTFIAVLAILALACWRLRGDRSLIAAAPPVLLILALLLLTAINASWFAPFGWTAYGPRLMLPWLPAIAVAAVLALPEATRAFVSFALGRLWLALPFLALALYGVALNVLARVTGAWTQFFVVDPHDPVCPRGATISEPDYYYDCLTYAMWLEKRSQIRYSLEQYASAKATPWLIVLAATLIACSVIAHRAVRGRVPSPA